MKVAIVGAGPAGSHLARLLAQAGFGVRVFDASHPREKPCGGGLTARSLALLPPAPADDPLPARWLEACTFEAGQDRRVDVRLERPVAIAARRDLDAWLLRRAVGAGAVHVAERVSAVGKGLLRTTAREEPVDVLVGADGAQSLVRRQLLGPIPKERLAIAAGWFAPGDARMTIRFLPGLAGYAWLFPRRDHVGVGICAPLGARPTRELIEQLEATVSRHYPALADVDGGRYAHTIPSPSGDPASILELAGPGWALVGDAAALADPITGEGIFPALRSAEILARTLLETGSTAAYPERLLNDVGRELVRAAALRDRFYSPGFTDRMIHYASRSRTIRSTLADLVLGEQGYLGLKRRLLLSGPRFLVEYGWSLFRGR
jgi:flavin-dependent dehydrogenase